MSGIRKLREAEGLTRAELADLLGVHRNTLKNWENGATEPKGSEIARIAGLFGVPVERVMDLPESAAGDAA